MGFQYDSFAEQVLACVRTRASAIWYGPPGCGKTMKLQYTLRNNRIDSEVVLLSLREPTDILGWPHLDKEPIKVAGQDMYVMHYAPCSFALKAGTTKKPLTIIFDELTTSSPSSSVAGLRILSEGIIGEVKTDPNLVSFLALANPPEQACNGFELTGPMANRLSHYQFDLDKKGWVENFPTYWDDPPAMGFGDYEIEPSRWTWARSLVAAFIKDIGSDEKFNGLPKDQSQWSKPWPSARSWDKASRFLAYVIQQGGRPEEALPLMTGAVGKVALEFSTWLKNKDLRNPEEVLEEEITAFRGDLKEDKWKTDKSSPFTVPSRGDIAYALLNSIASCVVQKMTPARSKAVWRILKAAAEQSAKDVAAAAAHAFFKEFYKAKGTLALPTEEIQPFIPFLEKMGRYRMNNSKVA